MCRSNMKNVLNTHVERPELAYQCPHSFPFFLATKKCQSPFISSEEIAIQFEFIKMTLSLQLLCYGNSKWT